jgi:PKD domain
MKGVTSALVRHAWGPLSSNKCPIALLIGAVCALVLVLAPAAIADSGDPVSYYGGPIVHTSTGVVVDWGSGVNPIFTGPTTGDPGLINYFASSSGSTGDVGGVLAQYMDTNGNAAPDVTYGGQFAITPNDTSTTIDDSGIQTELVSQIENGALPQPSGRDGLGTVYLVLFPPGDTECLDNEGTMCSGSSFCAYHGNARLPGGTAVLYAVLPDNSTGLMNQNCGPASTPLANQTSFLSHEWSEAITDPLVGEATSADGPPLAWYDDVCPTLSSTCGEIGDKCNQLQGLNGSWTVQLEWSNLDSRCEGSEPSYSAPTANFTANSTTYAGQPLGFDGASSSDPSSDQTSMAYSSTPYSINSGIASYEWNWGDATGSETGETASHPFADPGLYQVSMTVTDNLGFTSTVTHPVLVWSASPPVAPDVSNTGASAITAQSANLAGTVDGQNQPFVYSFAYGTSPFSLDQSTASTDVGLSAEAVLVGSTLSGLSPSTTYYYRVDVDIAGQTYHPNDVASFTTAPAPQDQSPGTGTPTGGTSTTTTPAPPATPPAQNPPAPNPAPGPSAARLPSAATGGTAAVTGSSATVAGDVEPDGLQTSYLVEFGRSTAYGHSSPSAFAGAGQADVAVRAALTGLRPRTVYHYRLVAINGAGTAVGADRTFKTAPAPPPPPRFSFSAPSRITFAQALAGKLRVQFRCSAACTAQFSVTLVLPGLQRLRAIPVTLARGSGHTRGAGTRGRATLRFSAGIQAAIARARSVKLVLSGYAVRGSSAPSAPRVARLTLAR